MTWQKWLAYPLLFLALLLVGTGWYSNRLGRQIYGGRTARVAPDRFLPAAEPLVIRNVNVLAPDGERFLPGRTVRLADGLIQSIDSAGTVLPGVAVVDGTGRYLIPGLTDAHVHLFQSPNDLLLYLTNGVTQIRELIGEPAHLEWKQKIARGERSGPRLFVASPRLGSFAPWEGRLMAYTQGYRNVPDAAAAVATVTELHARGYDGIKIYSQLNRESYRAIHRAADSLGLPTFGHIPWAVPLAEIWSSGQSDIAHFEELLNALQREFTPAAGGRSGSFYGHEAEFLDFVHERSADLATQLREHDITVTSTLWLTESFVRQKFALDSLLGAVELAYQNPGISEWVSFIPQGLGWLPAVNRYRLPEELSPAERAAQRRYWTAYGRACQLLANRLAASGVSIMAGTDANLPPAVPGFSLHDELLSLQRAGLSPAQVLRAATATPADWLGNRTGRIVPGYAADLVLLNADPLADIARAREIETVIAAGRAYDRALLDEMLAAVKTANDASRSVAIDAYLTD